MATISILAICRSVDRMILPTGREHSHGKTQYIPGKQVLMRSWLENLFIIDSSAQDLYIQGLWWQERSKWLSSATLVTMYLLGLLFTNWKKLLALVYLALCIFAIYYTTESYYVLSIVNWSYELLASNIPTYNLVVWAVTPFLLSLWLY